MKMSKLIIIIDIQNQKRISEFVQFFSKTLVEKTPVGTRLQIIKDQYVIYIHSRINGISVCLITDKDYPSR